MNNELKQIKIIYGEEMMHLCREIFPSILEKEGLLLSILESNLAPTHSFASDIKEQNLYEEFKNWIYSFIDVEKDNQVITNKKPFELMDEAGYTLYVCKSEEEIQSFRKYYADGEVLCTIYNGGRLNRCHVFFAVKKNVNEIKRENFTNPQREDKYGTSVISIQISKDDYHTLSIKNRYNHTVNNPDATFSNNLENIILGLSASFEEYCGFKINQQENINTGFLSSRLNYVKASDNKYYRYNIEINGIYYCENNIIIKDGIVITSYQKNKERYILMDQYILDLKDKKITLYRYNSYRDPFIKSINDIGEIRKIEIIKNTENRIVNFYYNREKSVQVEVDKYGNIIGYDNNYVTNIDDYFFAHNKKIVHINLPNVKKIGDRFLWFNKCLPSIVLPKVIKIGDEFLRVNEMLSKIALPNVKEIGSFFLDYNKNISELVLPNVKKIGSCFLNKDDSLIHISLPNVTQIDNGFLYLNESLSSIILPNVIKIGDDFLKRNEKLSKIIIPNVEEIGNCFLRTNNNLSELILPKVRKIGHSFLMDNTSLLNVDLPSLEKIDYGFLFTNENIDTEKIFEEAEERNEKNQNLRNR